MFEGVKLELAENAAIWVNWEGLVQPISIFWKLKNKLKIFQVQKKIFSPIFRGITCKFWRSNRTQKSGIFFGGFVEVFKQNSKAGISIVIKKIGFRIAREIAVK